LVSANAATRKMKKAIESSATFQPITACCWMMLPSATLPARSSTATVDIPIEISYDTICALERRPPSSAYLLFDDHPARTMPYTPSDAIARMKRKPIGRSATTMSIRPHLVGIGDANGITAQVMSAGMKASAGARMNSGM
jgi:hypothetical protein